MVISRVRAFASSTERTGLHRGLAGLCWRLAASRSRLRGGTPPDARCPMATSSATRPTSRDRAGREADRHGPVPMSRVFSPTRLRGQRHRHQADLVYNNALGAEKRNRLALQATTASPWRRPPDQAAAHNIDFEPADRPHRAYHLPTGLSRGLPSRATRRFADRCPEPRGPDPGRGPTPGRLLPTDHGSRRRDRAARHYFPKYTGRLPQVRSCWWWPTGELRLISTATCGQQTFDVKRPTSYLRQGSVFGLPADLGGDGERPNFIRVCRQLGQAGRLRHG